MMSLTKRLSALHAVNKEKTLHGLVPLFVLLTVLIIVYKATRDKNNM